MTDLTQTLMSPARSTESGSGGDVPAPTSHVSIPYLRHWRLHRLLSQSQLMKASGVSAPTIIRGEQGKPVYALSAAKLAHALGVTVKQLQGENPDE